MKIVATIEARMTSRRLPGKVLRPILGRPMLSHMIERLRWVSAIDEIIVATTENPQDAAIEALARELGVGCFRGSEEDVLDRVVQAARQAGADLMVETTGDCPVIDMALLGHMIHVFQTGEYDYVEDRVPPYPRGVGARLFRLADLEEIHRTSHDPADREHVSIYFPEHPQRYRVHYVDPPSEHARPDVRLTVDVLEDFQLVCAVYEALYPRHPRFGLTEILRFLDQHPELTRMNAHVQQKPIRGHTT